MENRPQWEQNRPGILGRLTYRPMEQSQKDFWLLSEFLSLNGWAATEDSLKWKYFENRSCFDFAIDDKDGKQTIASSYGVLLHSIKIGERTAVGALSVETLTGVPYRRLGLFTRLANMVYDRCEKEGVSLVYGFPNMNSAPGFFSRLGWTSLGHTPILFKLLRARCLFHLIKPPEQPKPLVSRTAFRRQEGQLLDDSQEILQVDNFEDERFDELWEAFSSQISVGIHRRRDYLRWRFSERPGANYRTLILEKDGKLEGFVTYLIMDKWRLRIGCIMELMYRPKSHSVGEALLDQAIYNISLEGGEMVLAVNLRHSPNHIALRKKGFRFVPNLLRPVKTVFGVKALRGSGEGTAIDELSNWYISFCDIDSV